MSRASMRLTAGLALGFGVALFSPRLRAAEPVASESGPAIGGSAEIDLLESSELVPTAKPAAHEPPLLAPTRTSKPKLQPVPADNEPTPDKPAKPADGEALVREAFALSKKAGNEKDLTRIIELCQQGMDAGIKGPMLPYAPHLMAWAHNRRGEVLSDSDRGDDAQADFEAAVRLDSSKWRYVHNRGVGFALVGKYDQAIADFDQTIRMNPRYANAYFNRGELRYERHDFVGAIEDYTHVLRLAPKDAAAYNSRGHAHYRLEQYREALADYNEAVRLDPKNAAAYTNRGDAYADLGEYAEAARDYQTALRLNPKLSRALQSAAWLMATCPNDAFRNDTLSVSAAKKAVEIEGEGVDYRFLETLAAAEASAGDYPAAVATQKKVVALVAASQREAAEARLKLYEERRPYRVLPRELPPEVARPSNARNAGRTAPQPRSPR